MIIRSFASNSSGSTKKHHCTLKIKHVGAGKGTVGKDLSYVYKFSLPPLAVNSQDVLTVSVESDGTKPNPYVIHSYASTSSGISVQALTPPLPLPYPASKGIASIDFALNLLANELALLSVIVIDTSKTPTEPYDLICCDPQVANDAKT